MAHEGEKPDLASPRDSASHKLPAARDSDTEADKTVPDAAALEFSDGGLQAWLVVSGSACVFFCTLGYLNSFGYVYVLQPRVALTSAASSSNITMTIS